MRKRGRERVTDDVLQTVRTANCNKTTLVLNINIMNIIEVHEHTARILRVRSPAAKRLVLR